MARWTGDAHAPAVLAAADAWRERCFLADGSLFGNEALWRLEHIQELKRRYVDPPIEDANRTFFDKLQEQLDGAEPEVVRLAAEVTWFLLLFPIHGATRAETKRTQIETVWGWSGSDLPPSPHLEDPALMGVGHPGTAYMTRRNEQFKFFLDFIEAWKTAPTAERERLLGTDVPWEFVRWIDSLEHAERRPIRSAILYFLFPDDLERNLSTEHRRQIVRALGHRLPDDRRPTGRRPSLATLDQAIRGLRREFETELDTTELDFYLPPIYQQWFIGVRDGARTEIGAILKKALSSYDLELRQCGSKKATLAKCKPTSDETGYWAEPGDATNKPLRWILHLAIEDDRVVARVPEALGSNRIAFANTAQGTSGAITTRIVPAIRIADEQFMFHETWEWLLLHCFFPALEAGSSGQLLEGFNAETGELRYKGNPQSYISASLITLNDDEEVFNTPGLPRPISYGEATEALARLIHVSPRTAPQGDAQPEAPQDGAQPEAGGGNNDAD